MKKILVTGSNGFIGTHICKYLISNGHNVIPVDKVLGTDLTNQKEVFSLPDVDIVLHLAAFNGTKYFYEKPFDVIKNNILPTQYLLERYAGKIETFIFTGSCESYAGAIDTFNYKIPTDENVPLVIDDITNPRWSYGGSKLVNELQVLAAYQQYKQPYTIIRYHNVYGPGQVDHFIPEFYKRAIKGDLSLYGWKNTRSFIYISDAIEATEKIMFCDSCKNQIINVGVNLETSIKKVAELICKHAGIKDELVLKNAPKGSVSRRCADITKLEKLVNFSPKISLDEGLKLTLQSLI